MIERFEPRSSPAWRRRRSLALLATLGVPALLLLAACETPALRQLPDRAPLRVNGSRVPTVALITYAGQVDPASVSDGTFCPHGDPARFARFFSAPEEILSEEMERSGYPVTTIPARLAEGLGRAYVSRVRVSFVGDSHCERRMPLFGDTLAEDCSVTVRLTVTEETPTGPLRRDFERTGESSLHAPVNAPPLEGPSPAWEAALRDAIRQVLADRTAVAFLVGRGTLASSRSRGLPR